MIFVKKKHRSCFGQQLVVLCDMVVWFRQALPYPRSNPEEAGSPASAAGLFAHRWPGVGRMLGAPDLHRVAALTWLDKPFRPTHPHVVVDV